MKRLFLFVFTLLFCLDSDAQSESNFVSVELPRGVQLQLPKGWWLLGDDYNQIIQSSVEAALDLSGVRLQDGQDTNLIAANSMPRSTYAAVRVDSTIPASISLGMFSTITPADVRDLEGEMRRNFQLMLPQQGLQLIEFLGTRIEKISGYPAFVTEYRRTGPKGPVWVQIIHIHE